MNQDEMLNEFMRHRDAEIRRDYDAIIDTFVEDCYIETIALGLRSDGREATRSAYKAYFTAFPDLDSDYQGFAAGDDVLVGWGVLSGTSGEWLGVAPTGGRFAVRFTNVATSEIIRWQARASTSMLRPCASRRDSRSMT